MTLQSVHPLTEQAHDGDQPTDRLSDRYPARLTSAHLMAIFSLRKSRFYQLENAKQFRRFELRPAIGRTAWSRALVQAYLDQVGQFAPVPFGVRHGQ